MSVSGTCWALERKSQAISRVLSELMVLDMTLGAPGLLIYLDINRMDRLFGRDARGDAQTPSQPLDSSDAETRSHPCWALATHFLSASEMCATVVKTRELSTGESTTTEYPA